MYKNQLQELAQRSCFNLPSYTCIRDGPDHAPRFKATVNFNGDTYESPNYCTTLRQAEHSAAEVALNELACRGPSNSLAARILDETGVYKSLLQEVSQRVGASLPTYTTFRSGLGHLPIFTCTVELSGCTFTGEPAKNKKQAEKNAAMSAWSSLKLLTQQSESSSLQKGNVEEQEHVIVARALQKFRRKARMSYIPFTIRFPAPRPKTLATQPPPSTTSKILPLLCPKTTSSRPHLTTLPNDSQPTETPQSHRPIASSGKGAAPQKQFIVTATNEPPPTPCQSTENAAPPQPHKFPAVGAAPYIPVQHFRAHHGIAPPVTIRNTIPVFSAPPIPPPCMGVAPHNQLPQFRRPPPMYGVASLVTIRQAVPVFSAPEAPTKPMTSSIPPTEAKGNAVSPEDSKSPINPCAASSPSTEEKGSAVLAISTCSPATPSAPKEEAGKLLVEGATDLVIR